MTKRSLIAICFVVPGGSVAVAVLAAAAREKPRPTPHEAVVQPVPHERRGHDAYKPRSATPPAGVVARSGPVVRGRFSSVQVNVDEFGQNIPGDAANEPSIAIDPTNPDNIAIGWRQFDSVQSDFRQAGYAYSRDAGKTWTFPGSLTPGTFGSDPVLMADAAGVFYYLSLNQEEMRLFRSFDGGISWPDQFRPVPRSIDFSWMTIDRSGGAGSGNLYIGPAGGVRRSTDGGVTFPTFVCAANGTMVTVDMLGTVYVAGSAGVFRSLRAATADSFTDCEEITQPPQSELTRPGPVEARGGGANPGGVLGRGWIAADAPLGPCRGRLYLLSRTTFFSRSDDGGFTWTPAVHVSDGPVGDGIFQWFGTMSVAPNGRIDVIWNDTRSSAQANLSEGFYSYSYDGGITWSKNVPFTPVWDSWIGWPIDQFKIGDYYDMISDDGGANLAFAATFNGEQDVYFIRLIPNDCNGNDVPDADDITSGVLTDCTANGIPDECEADCNHNGRADSCDIADGTSSDFTNNGRPDECESDMDEDGLPDTCDTDADGDGLPNVSDKCPRAPVFLEAGPDGSLWFGFCEFGLAHWGRFHGNLDTSGPNVPAVVDQFDLDHDGDIDLADIRLFLIEFGRDGR